MMLPLVDLANTAPAGETNAEWKVFLGRAATSDDSPGSDDQVCLVTDGSPRRRGDEILMPYHLSDHGSMMAQKHDSRPHPVEFFLQFGFAFAPARQYHANSTTLHGAPDSSLRELCEGLAPGAGGENRDVWRYREFVGVADSFARFAEDWCGFAGRVGAPADDLGVEGEMDEEVDGEEAGREEQDLAGGGRLVEEETVVREEDHNYTNGESSTDEKVGHENGSGPSGGARSPSPHKNEEL